ncbi:MAG: MarR family transcriptional regulator [Lachnospiraceae bacterium]|nr:MarR family transcriptional regulator [Lachnospiraceae bacterium]
MDANRTVSDILVNLFQQIWKLEEKALITEEYKDISVNDMHIIEAVGLDGGNNMSTIARKLDITVGSLTTSMNSLVLKNYVTRERSETDRRVVNICLTEKGKRAYRHHEQFHEEMAKAALQSLSDAQIPPVIQTLQHLSEFFRSYDE